MRIDSFRFKPFNCSKIALTICTLCIICHHELQARTDSTATINLGHRIGGEMYHPENTLYSYRLLLNNARDSADLFYMEFDIQETRDHKLVVFHDRESISRIVPDNDRNRAILSAVLRKKQFQAIRISDLTCAQITALELDHDAHIPTLESVLDSSVAWKVDHHIVIEIKSIHTDRARERLLDIANRYKHFLKIDFVAFEILLNLSFPDPKRWYPKFRQRGFRIYTARKAFTKENDQVAGANPEAADWSFITLLPETSFKINDEATRMVRYPLVVRDIPEGHRCKLRMGIYHGYDDSGDTCVTFKLLDRQGSELLAGKSCSRLWEWFEVELISSGRYQLELEDDDTALGGPFSGNGGRVMATQVVMKK